MMLPLVALCFVQTIHGIVRHPSGQNFRWQSGEMKVRKCELITIEMCRELGYNTTGMPNLIGHESQPDAEQQLSTFTPLIQYGCSSRLKFFLCSAYVPICSEKALQLIGPCEPLCDSVRRRCEPVLLKFGFPWPVALNCSKFLPRNEDDSMCIDVPTEDDETYAANTPVNGQFHLPEPATTHHTTPTMTATTGNCNVFRNPANYVPLNRTSRCALLCSRDDVFSAEQKMFADAWMSVWSGLCFVTTFITILTFLIDMQRIVYPERALVFMAVCYNVCSLSYLIRVTAGREAIACRAVPDSKKVVVQEGLENTECTFIFLLLYYFSMAGSIWWAILSVVWFLNAGLDRPYESFARHGTLLHVVAWSVPAAAAIVVIVLRSVDADELTAMCHVGYRNQNAQLWFVLIPTGVFLLVGVVFLTAGFICFIRTCKEVESTRPGKTTPGVGVGAMQSTARSSKIRMGAFLLVHVLLTVCILSIQCYEYANRQQWPLQPTSGDAAGSKPNVTVLMLGVAASLTIGIVSAIWLWKGENLQSWQRFCSRLGRCCRCTTRSKQQQQQGSSAAAAAVRKQTLSIATASTDSDRLQTPLARAGGGGGGRHPIYRVTTTTDAVERNGRHGPHSSIALNSSHHQCHHHHHHHHFHRNVSPLLKTHSSSSPSFAPHPPPPAPPPSCDKRSSRSPLQCRVFSSDISVL